MRTFVAVEIDNKDILSKIKSMQESVDWKAKPIRIDQIHFTLQFLGEISDEICENVKELLSTVTFSQFTLTLKVVGVFPNLKSPRVIWVGTDEKGAEKLIEISNEIEKKLSSIGFVKDKKFKPHLTVFRVKHKIGDISNEIKKYEQIEFGAQIVSKIKLKRSVLSPKGPEYSDLLVVNENEK